MMIVKKNQFTRYLMAYVALALGLAYFWGNYFCNKCIVDGVVEESLLGVFFALFVYVNVYIAKRTGLVVLEANEKGFYLFSKAKISLLLSEQEPREKSFIPWKEVNEIWLEYDTSCGRDIVFMELSKQIHVAPSVGFISDDGKTLGMSFGSKNEYFLTCFKNFSSGRSFSYQRVVYVF